MKVKKLFSVDDQICVIVYVECCKDVDVIDEILMVYKDIDVVMVVQFDLVEIMYVLWQVVCVKGQKMVRIIVLDGVQGEGGGQILCLVLSLLMIIGQLFEMSGICVGCVKLGLLCQYLMVV